MVLAILSLSLSDNRVHWVHLWHQSIDEDYLEELELDARQSAALYGQRRDMLCGAESLETRLLAMPETACV